MKVYRKPNLHRLGRIADMTKNDPGTGPDGNADANNNATPVNPSQ